MRVYYCSAVTPTKKGSGILPSKQRIPPRLKRGWNLITAAVVNTFCDPTILLTASFTSESPPVIKTLLSGNCTKLREQGALICDGQWTLMPIGSNVSLTSSKVSEGSCKNQSAGSLPTQPTVTTSGSTTKCNFASLPFNKQATRPM